MAGDLDDHDEDGPPFPWTVKVAGAIWAWIGWLGLVATFGVLIALPLPSCGFFLGLALAGAFIYVGHGTFRGDVADTMRNGIGSIGIGLVCIVLAGVMTVSGTANAGAFIAAPGSLLVAAGVLAIGGRTQYLGWKEHHPPEEVKYEDLDRDLRDNPPDQPTE